MGVRYASHLLTLASPTLERFHPYINTARNNSWVQAFRTDPAVLILNLLITAKFNFRHPSCDRRSGRRRYPLASQLVFPCS